MSKYYRWLQGAARQPIFPLLTWWAIALTALTQQSMWIDEWFTWLHVQVPWGDFVQHVIDTERRPPLHFALVKLVSDLLNSSEFAPRLSSIAFVLISIALIYVLGRRLGGGRTGLWAAWLLALSPFWLLYGRMMRAYSLTMCLALLSTWLLVVAPTRSRRWWLAYLLAAVTLIYTDYSGLAVIAAHGIYLLANLQRLGWRQLITWTVTVTLAAVAFSPWATVVASQVARGTRLTDLAGGPLGFLFKLAVPFYSWGAGESIYPWHPLGAAAVLVAGLLWLWGLVTAWHSRRQTFWLLLAGFAMPLLFTATLLTLIATDITFLNAAARSPAASPFFYLTVAGGIVGLRRSPVRWLAAGLLFAGFAAASLNYFQASQLLNPIHVVPARDVAATLAAEAAPGDLIVGESDTLIGHYYTLRPGAATYQDVDPADNLNWIAANAPQVVYLATFGRDSTANSYGTEELTRWLAEHYTLQAEQGYAPVDPVYQAFKSRLTGRPAYVYKLMVQKYVRP